MRFEPSGWSGNPKIGYAKSLMDYIARWLELRFLTGDQGDLFKALPMPVQPAIEANAAIRLERSVNLSRWEMRPPATSAVR